MTVAGALDEGRAAFARRAWADAYSRLSAADHEEPLSPEDLELLRSTNPAYGLGMSVAALQAAALRDSLADGDQDLARRYFRAAAKPASRAWQLAAGGDLSLPQVQGARPLPVRITNAYLNRALTAAERDPAVAERILRVASLQDPPPRMFRPSTALRAATASLRPRRSGDLVLAQAGLVPERRGAGPGTR